MSLKYEPSSEPGEYLAGTVLEVAPLSSGRKRVLH